jgi:hypothetical protein
MDISYWQLMSGMHGKQVTVHLLSWHAVDLFVRQMRTCIC